MTDAEDAAVARDGPTCLRCGVDLNDRAASKHHRKLKGRATPKREWDLVENIVVLCGTGTTGCHGWAHRERALAHITGWCVKPWEDPSEVLLKTTRGQYLRLYPDGTRTRLTSEPYGTPSPDPWLAGHPEQGAS